MLKNPIFIGVTALASLLTLSPSARQATRGLAVKGTAFALDTYEQVKDLTLGPRIKE